MGFLGSVLPSDGVKFTFDVDLMVDSRGKLTFAGGAGLTVTVPVNKSISVLTVRSVTVALAFEDGPKGAGASLVATVAFNVSFGAAFRIVVDQIGAKLVWTLPSSPADGSGHARPVRGNLGPAGDLALDFVPPKGIGVSIDIGPVKGGGFLFFDPPHRTYGGVLEASLALCSKGITIKAAGLLRETDDGWSFVVIVSAQFEPGIEIFLGLTLDGVGGMVGINVSVDVGKLQSGLHDGADRTAPLPRRPGCECAGDHRDDGRRCSRRGPAAGSQAPCCSSGWGRPNSYVKLSVAVVLAFPSPALLAILGRFQLDRPGPGPPRSSTSRPTFSVSSRSTNRRCRSTHRSSTARLLRSR